MLLDALLAYLHFVAVFFTGLFLALEWIRCRAGMDSHRVLVLFRNDLGYFLAAMVALASGLGRVFYGVKGPAYYFANPVFLAKIALFLLVALLSIPVTLAYRRWKKGFHEQAGYAVPEKEVFRARGFLLAQLLALAVLPVLAVLMARGIG
jgi:putative membrane protein